MKFNDIVDYGSNSITRFFRNDKDTMLKQTTFYDDKALALNDKIRKSGILENHTSNIFDEHAHDTRALISCPSVEQWELFKKQEPEVMKNLYSKDRDERMSAVKAIGLLHPSWLVYYRN